MDNTGDVVVEKLNEGEDTIVSSFSYTLCDNFENLTLSGTGNINGTGNSGNNILTGNSNNNILTGGAGNDTYGFGVGAGADTIVENDATAGNLDTVLLNGTTTANQLWFQQVKQDLVVSVIGTNDKLNIQNWYAGSQYHVEQFKTSDGKVLKDSQVSALVNAMATFTLPAAGQTVLPQNYQTTLAPVIAANWH